MNRAMSLTVSQSISLMDKPVPRIDSNFSDIILCYWLNTIFTVLKLNVIEPFFSFSNMNE